nr:ribonuclease III domain-containing protein [Prochlorothrix hollandica]
MSLPDENPQVQNPGLEIADGEVASILNSPMEADPKPSPLSQSITAIAMDGGQPLLSPQEAQHLSPVLLAYVGDAIYELYVRLHYLLPPQRIQAYHRQVVGQVRAEQQSLHLQTLRQHLTEAESAIVRRGRNAATSAPKRVKVSVYQQATALEALVGYLYLTDPARLKVLWQYLVFCDSP